MTISKKQFHDILLRKQATLDNLIKSNCTFVSSHDGHIIRHGGYGIRNSYEIWEHNVSKAKYIRMKILHNDTIFNTVFDYQFLDLVTKSPGTWCLSGGYDSKYINNSNIKKTLHHLVTGYVGQGKGTGTEAGSVNHYNRNIFDNRLENLEITNAIVQAQNMDRIITEQARRRSSETPLPDSIKNYQVPRYVHYSNKNSKEFFAIEHPFHELGITINGTEIPKFIKSRQGLTKYTIEYKLKEIRVKAKALREVYNNWNKEDKNIIVSDNRVINAIIRPRKADNKKQVYKYTKEDDVFILIKKYDSVDSSEEENGSVRRKLNDNFKAFENDYTKYKPLNKHIYTKFPINEEDDEDENDIDNLNDLIDLEDLNMPIVNVEEEDF